MFSLNLRKELYILELAGRITCTRPIDANRTKKVVVFRHIQWVITMLDLFFVLVVLVLGIFHSRHDVSNLMQDCCDLFTLIEVILDLVLCKKNHVQLQVIASSILKGVPWWRNGKQIRRFSHRSRH